MSTGITTLDATHVDTACALAEETTSATTNDLDSLLFHYDQILSVGEECISATELKTLLMNRCGFVVPSAVDSSSVPGVAGASTVSTVGASLAASTDSTNVTSATAASTTATTSTSTTPTGFVLYDGFEPSGRMHIAQGVLKAVNVNKCTACPGATFCFWVADWFALMNDKMGGDLEKIQTVGHYLIEVWKAAGMNLDQVVFRWASHDITHSASTYWPIMLDVARRFTIPRIKKCCQIMGRLENTLTAAQILYPLMQCTDIFFLKADICQLGVDQRKVNMLAREYCDAAKRKLKPIILSHHMLYGLKQGQAKMSKSDPDSAIFMEDSRDDVARKINNAYCPTVPPPSEGTEAVRPIEQKHDTPNDEDADDAGKASMNLSTDTLKNPCLDYVQHIILSPPNATFTAAGTVYTTFMDVKKDFLNGTITEAQLKQGLIEALNNLLEPVRTHFTTNAHAKELLQKIVDYKKETAAAVSTESTVKAVRRLNLVQLNRLPPQCHLVLAPLPHANPTLQEAMDILARLRHSRLSATQPMVLLLQDWSAIVCNACQADPKGIAAYYKVLLTCLTTLNPEIMASVHVVTQSEAILLDPSNYWISVINAGRQFQLDAVMGDTIQDSDAVGLVIARLMTFADVAGVEPATLTLAPSHSVERDLIPAFFASSLLGVTQPTIDVHSCRSIRLQPPRESEALATENDEYFLLDDPKVHGKSKMNKSFAEEGNVEFCPALNIASVFCFGGDDALDASPDGLLVQRAVENGGEKTYRSLEDLVGDYKDASMHPGDLKKNAMIAVVTNVLEKLTIAVKADKTAGQASKTLKALLKKKK